MDTKIITANLNGTWWFDTTIDGCPKTIRFKYVHSRSGKFDHVDVVEQVNARTARAIARLVPVGDDQWEIRLAWRVNYVWITIVERLLSHLTEEIIRDKVAKGQAKRNQWMMV